MARRPNAEVDALIGQYQHESQRSRSDQALFMLRKIGSIVKPIMRQRMWRVGTLAEFYPTEQNLLGLNINRGQKINLRLRYPGDADQFLPIEQVVDTMLHELCHIVIGPHNQEFHALWDQLRDEHESLIRKGYTGEGFLGRGQKLGGNRVPMHEARRLAKQAAERRRTLQAGSGQRLGGAGIMRGQDARAVIAAAVERRNRIERGCASGTAAGEKVARDEAIKQEKVTTTQAGPEDENEATMMQAYIDLIQEEEREKFGGYYSPPTAENPAGPRARLPSKQGDPSRTKSLIEQQKQIEADLPNKKTQIEAIKQSATIPQLIDLDDEDDRSRTVTPQPPTIAADTKPIVRPQPSQAQDNFAAHERPILNPLPDTWTCEVCTLVNPIDFLTCDACTVERPGYISQLQEQLLSQFTSNQQSQERSTSNRLTDNGKPDRETPNALKPRSSAYESARRFETERTNKLASGPLGWRCAGCGNFMEQQWWTCSACGRMKESS